MATPNQVVMMLPDTGFPIDFNITLEATIEQPVIFAVIEVAP